MNKYIKQNLNVPSFFLGCILIFISCFGFYSFGNRKPTFLNAIDYRVMDMMFRIRGAQPDTGQVVILDIDEKSLKQIGQWPWSRNILADITRNLTQSGAKAIGFDIVFAEKDRTSPAIFLENIKDSIKDHIPEDILSDILNNEAFDYDTLFGEALSMSPSVLGYGFQLKNDNLKSDEDLPFPSSTIRIFPENVNFKDLSLIPAYRAIINHPSVAMSESEGFFNVFTDDSGTTRQVPLMMIMDDIPYPSLALETFRVGMQIPSITIQASDRIKLPRTSILGLHMGNLFIPTDGSCQIFVNHRGPVNTFQYISALDALENSNLPGIKDKFVLIGASATGLFDLKATPFSNAMPGIEINATIVDNLINSDPFIYDILTEIGLTYTFIIAGGLLLTIILSISGPLAGGLGAIIFFLASLTWNYYYFFLNNRHIGITYPMITCAGILLLISIFNSFREGKTKRFIQKAFSHYVAPDVVTQLLKNPESLSLQGEERELTILFLDIRGFTTISEQMTSLDLGNFMNDFLTRMSHIIMENDGTVDKFIGDAIMAFWGAPRHDPLHAEKAVRASLLLKEEVKKLQAEYQKKNFPAISVGIGINSGVVSVGNFGSNTRFDYTVMGDNVNLASRLEGANKNYGTTILISEATKDIIIEEFFCQYIDKVQVKGRKEAVNLYEPISEGLPSEEMQKEVKTFENAIQDFQQQNFEKAEQTLVTLQKSNPTKLYQAYIDRCRGFIKYPPPKQWDGSERRREFPVTKLTTK